MTAVVSPAAYSSMPLIAPSSDMPVSVNHRYSHSGTGKFYLFSSAIDA
jgi:hypothetical protein